MTSWRKQLTGDELVALLRQGADQENRRASYGTPYGEARLFACLLGEDRDDGDRAHVWKNYERLIWRYYGTGMVTVSEDGTRLPWSPDRLGSVAP